MSGGIECPYCASTNTRVVDSRPDADRCGVKRKRECSRCGIRWTTCELDEDRIALLEDAIRDRPR